MSKSTKEKRDRVRKLIEGIDIAMFTTHGEGGFPVSRPLSTQDTAFDGELLWFFVRRNSPKVAEIGRNPKVNVSYASNERNAYISIAGVADLVDDQAKIDEFWNDGLKAFFGRGRKDPQLTLIRVRVRTVQFWEGPSTGIGKLIAFVVARVTKNDGAMGENLFLRVGGKRGGKVNQGQSPARRTAAKNAPGRSLAARRTTGRGAPAAKPKTASGKRPAARRTATGSRRKVASR